MIVSGALPGALVPLPVASPLPPLPPAAPPVAELPPELELPVLELPELELPPGEDGLLPPEGSSGEGLLQAARAREARTTAEAEIQRMIVLLFDA
jgi:hypothetical protein